MKRIFKFLACVALLAVVVPTVSYGQAEDTRTVMKSFVDSIQQNNAKITINTVDPLLNIAVGNVEGCASDHKFGRNIEVDSGVTADIWDGGSTGDVSLIWVAPTQARLHNIASTNAADDGDPAGTGTNTLEVFGLTDWDSGVVSEIITMNGTSNVSTDQAYVMINRMKVLTKGSGDSNVGTITATAVTDATITSQIRAGVGQTEQTPFGFPSSQNMYVDRIHADQMKAGGATGLADIDFLFNPEPQTELTNFVSQNPFGLLSTGTSGLPIIFKHPKEIEGPGLTKMQILAGVNNMDISAGYDFVLVDNNNNSPANLLAGGANDGFKLADTHGRFLLPD